MSLPSQSFRTAAVATVLFCLSSGAGLVRAQAASYDPHKAMLAKGHFDKGMKLVVQGKEGEGEAELLEAVKIFPELADAHVQLGNLSMRRKNFTEGLERYLQAQHALGRLQGVARSQGMERQRQIQENLDVLRERVSQLQRSQVPGAEGKIEQNLAQIEKLEQEQKKPLATDRVPIPAELYFLTGNARMNLERFDDAIQDYKMALSLNPNFGEAHNNLAVIFLYRKDYGRAWEHVHAAEKAGVRINPEFREELAALTPEPPPPAHN